MERLNFENLGFAKMKKTSTSAFAYCWKWFRNWIPFIHISESQIQQLRAFFWKQLTWNVTANEFRCLSFFWKIPLQTFRIQSCMYRSEKVFDVCIPRLKTKKEEWKVVCNDAFHSVLTRLRILIWSKSCFWPSAFVL